MVSANLIYWIPLMPLIAALVIFFVGRWLPLKGAWLGILATLACFLASIDLYWQFADGSLHLPFELPFAWFTAGIYPFEWGLLLDGSSIGMMLMVSAVSLLVQVYSVGYMQDSPRFKRYFAYVSLFTAAMLALVMANNYLQFFVGWELMGACSYFLIGFEFERDAAARAGNKAFLTTRLGDLGFYAGLLVIFFSVGTFNFGQIQQRLMEGAVSVPMARLIALLMFCGAVGKSAQFPLHTWLADAMEGPTPVSALIHAATMVAAGVYLVARTYGFFLVAPSALEVVAGIGALTAIFAATLAVVQNDLKRVLAYSTISQLGYMMLALGVGGYAAGLFHLTTHAAFKALLFLAAGSVIHAVHTNDIWKMGSLSKQMLTTTLTFLAGYAALIGLPPFAGFYSKEMILSGVFASHHVILFSIGVLTAFLTAFYMTRLLSLVFLGDSRERDRFAHALESPWIMTLPLIALALPSVLLGFMLHHGGLVEKIFDYPGVETSGAPAWVSILTVAAALAGMLGAGALYLGSSKMADQFLRAFRPVHTLLVRGYFVDELYERVVVRPIRALASGLAWIDRQMVDRFWVGGFTGLCRAFGGGESGPFSGWVQSGLVQNYLLAIVIGLLCLAFYRWI